MVTLQSVQGHTGLTHHFYFFDIRALWRSVLSAGLTHHFYFFDIRALWRSVLSARVPECQKNKNGGLDQYGFEHFVV